MRTRRREDTYEQYPEILRRRFFFALLAGTTPLFAQTVLTVEPDPSYREDAVSVRRHPEVDTNVSLYIRHWRESPPVVGHGGFIERDILTPGEPQYPLGKGAVLTYASCYRRAVLEPRTNTRTTMDPKEQVFLYFTSGADEVPSHLQQKIIAEAVKDGRISKAEED